MGNDGGCGRALEAVMEAFVIIQAAQEDAGEAAMEAVMLVAMGGRKWRQHCDTGGDRGGGRGGHGVDDMGSVGEGSRGGYGGGGDGGAEMEAAAL